MSTELDVAREAAASEDGASFLEANDAVYRWLVRRVTSLHPRREPEELLHRVTAAAAFAGAFHTGRFADGAIENPAWEVGRGLQGSVADDPRFPAPPGPRGTGRRVLHVASHMVEIAGHARMLAHWARNDRSSSHSLVLVNQGRLPVPQWLTDAVRESGGALAVLPAGAAHLHKAGWLRASARKGADLVVLHHDGHDVVPTVAFATDDSPPVAVLNHADHLFWMGSSVADMVIHLRSSAAEHGAARRFVSCNTVLPIPLEAPASGPSRQEARRALGIPDDQLVLLSVARAEKFRPCGSYDFVATVGRILDRQPDAHHYVVGETLAGMRPHLRCEPHERMHFVGPLPDASPYRAAADIYLESFPFGSNTAFLEAALSGLPAVPAYAPLSPFLVAGTDALRELLPTPRSEQEYVDRAEQLMRRTRHRVELGEALRTRLASEHVGDGWLARLHALYEETDRLAHAPRRIPVSTCDRTSLADVRLSRFRVVVDGRTFTLASSDSAAEVLRHSAYIARVAGDYPSARRHAWHALRRDPLCLASWRLLGVTLLGRAAPQLRRVLPRG